MMGDLTEQLFFCLEVVCGMKDFNNNYKGHKNSNFEFRAAYLYTTHTTFTISYYGRNSSMQVCHCLLSVVYRCMKHSSHKSNCQTKQLSVGKRNTFS